MGKCCGPKVDNLIKFVITFAENLHWDFDLDIDHNVDVNAINSIIVM